jgi:hypothetical protein
MNILRDTPTPLPEAHAPAGGHELPDDDGAGASGAALALEPPAAPPPPPLQLQSQMCGGCWAALQARACPCCTPSSAALLARAPSPEPDGRRAFCELLLSTDDATTVIDVRRARRGTTTTDVRACSLTNGSHAALPRAPARQHSAGGGAAATTTQLAHAPRKNVRFVFGGKD